MTPSLQNADMTRDKRGRNAKMTQHDAKNNARITRDNAGVCGSRTQSGAAYVLYLRGLRPDVGSDLKKCYPALVNSNWLGGAANPCPTSHRVRRQTKGKLGRSGRARRVRCALGQWKHRCYLATRSHAVSLSWSRTRIAVSWLVFSSPVNRTKRGAGGNGLASHENKNRASLESKPCAANRAWEPGMRTRSINSFRMGMSEPSMKTPCAAHRPAGRGVRRNEKLGGVGRARRVRCARVLQRCHAFPREPFIWFHLVPSASGGEPTRR
jgi:hypothetical protein